MRDFSLLATFSPRAIAARLFDFFDAASMRFYFYAPRFHSDNITSPAIFLAHIFVTIPMLALAATFSIAQLP